MQWVFKPLSVLIGFAFLSLLGAAYIEIRAEADTNARERPGNIERNAHRVADAIESLNIVLPKGELVDLTDQLRAVGIKPFMTAPDCPELCLGPTKIYASALPGYCRGLALVGIAIYDREQSKSTEHSAHLSLIGSEGDFIYRWGDLSHAGVIDLIATLAPEVSADC